MRYPPRRSRRGDGSRLRPLALSRLPAAALAVGLLGALGLAACGTSQASTDQGGAHGAGGGSGATTSSRATTTTLSAAQKIAAQGATRFRVGVVSATWADPDGATEDFATGETTPGRSLGVEIRYPTTAGSPTGETPGATPAYGAGPFPVVVFAHGYDVTPDTYAPLLDAWVSAGFVVVAPVFPDTSATAIAAEQGAYTESDMFNQPADVAFVVRELARATGAAPGPAPPGGAFLRNLVYLPDLAIVGQSDGADTVAALLFDDEYSLVDYSLAVRPKAVGLLSGAEWTRTVDVYRAPVSDPPAVLVVQSATDTCNTPLDSALLNNLMGQPKWYLSLDDATHLGPYTGQDAEAPVVERVTIAFFSHVFGRRAASAAAITAAGDEPGLSSVSSAPSVEAPAVAAEPVDADPCGIGAGTPPVTAAATSP